MRILAALLKYDYGMEARGESLEKRAFYPAFQRLGHEVIPFWLEEHGFPKDGRRLQSSLIECAEKIKPDLIFFILMRDEITIETLDTLSAKYGTMNWFCDDQWRFEDYTRYVAPHLKYCVTVDKFSLPAYRSIGIKNVLRSQWAAEYHHAPFSARLSYEYDVSFVGGKNPVREWIIQELKAAGIEVACFGSGWEGGKVSFERMNELFVRSKISLNLSNSIPDSVSYRNFFRTKLIRAIGSFRTVKRYPTRVRRAWRELRGFLNNSKTMEQIKARNFEIPAAGGFQISRFALEIDDYFVPGKEIVLYSTLEELGKLIKYYLANDEEREQIRLAGNARASSYTYETRLAEILDMLKHDDLQSESSSTL